MPKKFRERRFIKTWGDPKYIPMQKRLRQQQAELIEHGKKHNG